MKHSSQTKKIIEEVVKQKPKARWLFLTLTVKNWSKQDSKSMRLVLRQKLLCMVGNVEVNGKGWLFRCYLKLF